MKTTPVHRSLLKWNLVSGTTLLSVCMVFAGCGSNGSPASVGGPGTPQPTGPFVLTVGASDSIQAGVPITASPADTSSTGGGNAGGTLTAAAVPTPTTITGPSTETCQGSSATCTTFTLNYAAGTLVQLTAPPSTTTPATSFPTGTTPSPLPQEIFSKWIGCQSSVGATCTVKVQADTYVEAVYAPQVTVALGASSGLQQLVGTNQQVYLTVTGQVPDVTATYTVLGPPGYTGDVGDVVKAVPNIGDVYYSPYPAPPYVVIMATSNYDPVSFAYLVIQLGSPTPTVGPALTVDTSAVTHTISPLIYGVNLFEDGTSASGGTAPTVDRWGGDAATRYNYLLDTYNSAADYYFETNPNSNTAYPDTSTVNTQVGLDIANHLTTIVTMPMIGYLTQGPGSTPAAQRAFACGFSVKKYGAQQAVDQYNPDCGKGIATSTGNPINSSQTANVVVGSGSNAVTVGYGPVQVTDPADTSVPIDQTFTTNWVNYLVGKFGNAASGGVNIYQLDNEPEYWNGVHQDVHPAWLTYDEVTNKGIAYATAIKNADPTAQVSGPVISNWQNFFYSTADQWSGYEHSPYVWNALPADYNSHNNTYLLPYYLQQMSAASTTAGHRLLDYLDVHAYGPTANTSAGDTSVQEAREDGVRIFWDPTYLNANYSDPAVVQGQPVPIQFIPYLKSTVAANYPGTKTAITEYNAGGEESISGAIAQAETLAVFGWQGLDMGLLWSEPLKITDPTYVPTQTAFNFFLNYDGAGSKFGDGSLNTNTVITGTDPNGNPTTTFGGSQIAIYAAKRSSDGAVTVILFNKTYQPENTSLALTDASTSAKVYQYTVANLAAIVPLSDATVAQANGTGTVTLTLPAQSITLLVFPQ
jgi:hypothetical protein